MFPDSHMCIHNNADMYYCISPIYHSKIIILIYISQMFISKILVYIIMISIIEYTI